MSAKRVETVLWIGLLTSLVLGLVLVTCGGPLLR
jgi:hypothetical protein